MKTIQMKGAVVPNDYADVYDLLGYQNFTPEDIEKQLSDAAGDNVKLEINSPGGYVDAGSEIYTMLKKYNGQVNAEIIGQACSAASWIALAADHVAMSPTAQIMIHRAMTSAQGNADDFKSALNSLDEMDKSYVDLYSQKTGKSPEEIYQLMANSTWMNAKTAKENGFVDEIMFQNEREPAAVNADGSMILNETAISKIKNLLHKPKPPKPTSDVAKPTKENSSDKRQVKKDLSLLLWK